MHFGNENYSITTVKLFEFYAEKLLLPIMKHIKGKKIENIDRSIEQGNKKSNRNVGK